MASAIVRSERWGLRPSSVVGALLALTVREYRAYVRALVGVVWTHWRTIDGAESQCTTVERLVHATRDNPDPRYRYFDRRFPKFPSYLRRAAIEAACGQVSSFVTRYDRWQGGRRGRRTHRPPKLVADSALNPPLYRGQCVKFDAEYRTAEIKVFTGKDWVWEPVAIGKVRKRHLLANARVMSPTLLHQHGRWVLSVPMDLKPSGLPDVDVVCALDLGINTTAVASIVRSDGVILDRRFFHNGAAIDARDKIAQQIRQKARLTMGSGGTLCEGFCSGLYRRAAGLNENMAQHISKAVVEWAAEHGVTVIVLEHLKHYRPKGGKKRSGLKQRFHGWLHRRLAELIEAKWVERGGRVRYVRPRGTSSFAYDGSGPVRRGEDNYALATFASGKQYNADLSASYNVGARCWARELKLVKIGGSPDGRKGRECRPGERSGRQLRTPVTLSTLWAAARDAADCEAPTAFA